MQTTAFMEATNTAAQNPALQGMINELTHEAAQTRKMLERVPFDKLDYKPHEKSMSLGRLATHVAELPRMITVAFDTDELDFAKQEYKPHVAQDKTELLQIFDEKVQNALASLHAADNESMMQPWTMRHGEQIFFTLPRIAVVRNVAMNHLIHHRGQLSVYLRLNDVPVPGMYGPTADERW
jgi:uncharacterized damage-inducible protein DinB